MFRIVAIFAVLCAVVGLAVPAEAGNCFGGQAIIAAPQAIVFPGYQSLVTGPQLLVQQPVFHPQLVLQQQPVFFQPQQQFLVSHQRQLLRQRVVVQRAPVVQRQVIRQRIRF